MQGTDKWAGKTPIYINNKIFNYKNKLFPGSPGGLIAAVSAQ